MKQLVLIRHGESAWNLENRFTGWADVDLTPKGSQQALAAGESLRNAGYEFDIAYTSVLRRAIRTLWHVQDKMDLMWLPVVHSWRLNERHYGALTGLNKAETAAQYGDAQVHIWRRSYDTRPPLLSPEDDRNSHKDPRYSKLNPENITAGECLKDNVERNSIRSLIKYLDKVSDQDIMEINVPNGIPLVYELDDDLNPTQHFYLD